MTIEPFKVEDAYCVNLQAAQARSVMRGVTMNTKAYASSRVAITARIDGEIVGCAGIIDGPNGRGATDRAREHWGNSPMRSRDQRRADISR